MSRAIHLYHRGDRLRASLTRELTRAGLAVEAFASPEALLAAARAARPDAILWDVDATPAAGARALGAPLVLLTRSREAAAAHHDDQTLVLPFERWRVAPLTAALVGLELPAETGRARRSSQPRIQHDTLREAHPRALRGPDLDDLDVLEAARPSELTPPPSDATPTRVLVADDDEVLQHILGYQLGDAGWDVVRASDGIAAQVALAAGPYDLVLLDLNLPHVNGFELLELLDLRHSDRKTQVVVMSEQTQDDKIIRAFSLGAHDFLQKPLNPQVALSRFRRLLERA